MIHHGKIEHLDTRRRTLTLKTPRAKRAYYLQRAQFNRYLPLLAKGNYVVLDAGDIQRKHGLHRFKIRRIRRIVAPGRRPRDVFSQRRLREGVRRFINRIGTRLFLDFEMSMHPYHKQPDFTQEIIQAGYVLVDAADNVLEEHRTFIRPKKHPRITPRTKKFLDVGQADVDDGVSFETFYARLRGLVQEHAPAIVVWGRNDKLALQEAYTIHNLRPLGRGARFVNLLELHKNYFHLKNDLGLLKTYLAYGFQQDEQAHDALEDARMTRHIFTAFKRTINDPTRIGPFEQDV